MRYVVIAAIGSLKQEIATKACMDDALDVIREMEAFDKAENMLKMTEYTVKMVKED